MYKMDYPNEDIWEFPGIYSLTISYGVYNSFYFSQYIGLGMIHFFEFREQGYHKFQYAMLLTQLMLTFMLVFTRGHYSIDIFGGYVFGHYFWMFADKWSWMIDYQLLKIPFYKRYPYFRRTCFKCKEPVNQWATFLQSQVGDDKRRSVEQDEILAPIRVTEKNKGMSKKGSQVGASSGLSLRDMHDEIE